MYFEPPTPQQTIERVIGNGSSQKEHTNVLIGMSVLLKSLLTVSKKLLSLTISKMDQSGVQRGIGSWEKEIRRFRIKSSVLSEFFTNLLSILQVQVSGRGPGEGSLKAISVESADLLLMSKSSRFDKVVAGS